MLIPKWVTEFAVDTIRFPIALRRGLFQGDATRAVSR